MSRLVIILVFIVCSQLIQAGTYSVYEANYPGVKDYNINIDDAVLVVHPHGNFVEINIYMTVSYDFESWYFKNYNELEFLWNFSLSQQALMHDFWIWQGDSILRAEVLDKWTAELLFSEVSSPVRNPGLLTASAANASGMVNYELRIFPVIRNEKKRFKLQYLVPGRPSVETLRIWLPTLEIFSDKARLCDQVKIIYKYNDVNLPPEVIGANVLSSEHFAQDSAWILTIPFEKDLFAELLLPVSINENFYFSTFESNGEKYYQLAVYPPAPPLIDYHRNILMVIDFNYLNTSGFDGAYLVSLLKEISQEVLDDTDSLNILIAYDEIVMGADHWVSCSNDNLDSIFSTVMKTNFPSYNNFQPLMVAAANYVNQQIGSTEVMLFSNISSFNLSDEGHSTLAGNIVAMFKSGTKIHVADLNNKKGLRYVSGNYYYNAYYPYLYPYFFSIIASGTEGNYYSLQNFNLKTILNALFYEKVSHFESIEVQMSFSSGYAHSKYFFAQNEGYYPTKFPIMQVGKYTGTLPLDINVLGKLRMETVSQEYTITENDVRTGNSMLPAFWSGNRLRELLKYSYSPVTVNDIIQLSIQQRILTPYTGFLVYKPDENHGFCTDCVDETDILELPGDEPATADSLIKLSAYPNPFNDRVHIAFNMPPGENAELVIFNIMGQKVWSKNIPVNYHTTRNVIEWDGKNSKNENVASGVYLLYLKGITVHQKLKLLYVQ